MIRKRLLQIIMGGPAFLIKDDFTNTLAAGAINGTVAPGVGTTAQKTRLVTDAESKYSISGGNLVSAGGKAAPAWGDPGLWYGAFARTLGRTFITKITPAATNTYFYFGLDANQAGQPVAGIQLKNNGKLLILDSAITLDTIAYTAAELRLAISTRVAGQYYYAKTGSVWLLIWVGTSEATANLYPGAQNYNLVFTDSFIRIPVATYIPIPLAYDAFGRANGALGSTETSGPDGASQPTTALVWTGTTWTISTNKAVNAPTLGSEQASGNLVVGTWYSITATQVNYFYTGCAVSDVFVATATTALDANNKVKALTTSELFATFDAGVADVIVGVDIVGTSQYQEGIVVNLDSAATPLNYIHAYLDRNIGAGTTRILLDEIVAGTRTNKITVTNATYVSGAQLLPIRDGTSCALIYNNIQVGTTQTMTANTNTRVGISSTGGASSTHDNILVMPRGNNGEYSGLNIFITGRHHATPAKNT